MRKHCIHILALFLGLLTSSATCLAADLTALEMRWLKGVWPVLVFAKAAGMPMDISVQPQPTPGTTPLALAFVDGRCKLVLSMRGNSEAQASLDRITPELMDETLQLMAAHELGHCRRYLDGNWFALPAGFRGANPSDDVGSAPPTSLGEMKAQRREEAYADLVGLAWVQQQHGPKYASIHAWLVAERSRDLLPGSEHDTLAWIEPGIAARATGEASIFSTAAAIWVTKLRSAE